MGAMIMWIEQNVGIIQGRIIRTLLYLEITELPLIYYNLFYLVAN